MKRKIISVVLSAAMIMSLAACGSSDSSSSSTDTSAEATETAEVVEEAAEEEETVEVSGDVTVVQVWSEDRHDESYVEEMVDKYNETNTDNIYIELTIIADNYADMVTLAYQGGTAPDIVGANSFDAAAYIDTGILYPLDEYIAADEEYQLVNEPYEHAYEGKNARNGSIYHVYSGIRSGVRVEYNKDLLEAAGYDGIPSTLREYVDMIADLTEQGASEYYGIGFTSSGPFGRLLEASAQISGIQYYDYVNGVFDFSGYKEIMELGSELVQYAYPDQQGVDNMRALFTTQAFVCWSNASQEVAVFTEQLPIEDFEWGVGEVPSLNGYAEGALETVPQKSYGIISTSDVKDEAWKVISYFQSEEFLKGYFEGGYCLPISTYMDGVIDKSAIGRLADFSLLDYESVYPAVPTINLSGTGYSDAMWDAIMGYADIDDTIEDLNNRYNEALEADIANGSTQRIVIADYDPLHPSQGTAEYLDE